MKATTPLLISAPDAARLLGVSERSFHNLRHRPDFPRPITIGTRCVRWRVADLEAFIEALPPANAVTEPR